MNLILFDIDGTITNTTLIDYECFVQTFHDLFRLDVSDMQWNDFEHVTDSGVTSEIFKKHLKRELSEEDEKAIKFYFFDLLNLRKQEISEIPGAIKTLQRLSEMHHTDIAFATGGWKMTAIFKLGSIGYEIGNQIIATADDHFDRAQITLQAINQFRIKHNLRAFESITYIGDGLWDLKASRQLGINFIGIDYLKTNELISAGAEFVIEDLLHTDKIIQWIADKNRI